ncbi:hypothetical protein DRN38_05945 [Thermococci archaeon]|nr:MAG: hypothetical protein DRN38_05945 [Thermococci archaeon]
MVEIYEIDDVVKQVKESREPDYRAMWNELKHRIEILMKWNKKQEEEKIKNGDITLAITYGDWAIENKVILNLMKKIEKKHISS